MPRFVVILPDYDEEVWDDAVTHKVDAGVLSIYANFFEHTPMVRYAPGEWRRIIRT